MAPTMDDVATRAGVSPATVSRVLNKSANVAEGTRRKVLHAMKELHYEPNLLASALATKKTNTLGLLIPDVSNPFFAEVTRALEQAAGEREYNVVVCNTDDMPAREERYLNLLRQKGVDGIIVSPSPESLRTIQTAIDAGYPICFLARDVPTLAANSVRVDDFQGGYMAGRHLAELGHARIAMISESKSLPSSPDRIAGFRKALEEYIGVVPTVIETAETSIPAGIEACAALLQAERPTAVFCANDMLAIGVIHQLRRTGLDVPDDVSVVGFDGTLLSSVVDPPLTTVVQPIKQMAKAALRALTTAINHGENETQRIVFQPVLRKDRSTAPPRKSS